MEYDRLFFEKIFSTERMNKYFLLYPCDSERAIEHYKCNLMLSESLYTSLSVFEITLRNALVNELKRAKGDDQWYLLFDKNPALLPVKKHIMDAEHNIKVRKETITPSKITAELTFGFWVSLLNSEYENLLWHDLRRAFPNMPKTTRKRKNISSPLNHFRTLRNRIYHNEPICWNLSRVEYLHDEMFMVLGWMNKDLPMWLQSRDRFKKVCAEIRQCMGWR